MLEILLIVLLIIWLSGGLLVLPGGMGLINILIFVVLIWVILQIRDGRRM